MTKFGCPEDYFSYCVNNDKSSLELMEWPNMVTMELIWNVTNGQMGIKVAKNMAKVGHNEPYLEYSIIGQ